jgi:site-specific DNA-methyltransferase (adenine-specific)
MTKLNVEQEPLFQPLECELRLGSCDHILRMYPNTFQCMFVDWPYFTQKRKTKAATYTISERLKKQNWKDFAADWDDGWDDHWGYFHWVYSCLKVMRESLTDDGSIFSCGSHHGIWAVKLALIELGMYTIQDIDTTTTEEFDEVVQATQDVVWAIPNAFPHLARKQMASSHQTILWARKGKQHIYDWEAAQRYNDGKNLRDYWTINNAGYLKDSKHPSKKPPLLMKRAFDIATRNGAIVCDPMAGSGRSYVGAQMLGDKISKCVLIEREESYVDEMVGNYKLTKIENGLYSNRSGL